MRVAREIVEIDVHYVTSQHPPLGRKCSMGSNQPGQEGAEQGFNIGLGRMMSKHLQLAYRGYATESSLETTDDEDQFGFRLLPR